MRELHDQLATTAAWFRALVQHAEHDVIVTDRAGRIVYASPRGKPSQELRMGSCSARGALTVATTGTAPSSRMRCNGRSRTPASRFTTRRGTNFVTVRRSGGSKRLSRISATTRRSTVLSSTSATSPNERAPSNACAHCCRTHQTSSPCSMSMVDCCIPRPMPCSITRRVRLSARTASSSCIPKMRRRSDGPSRRASQRTTGGADRRRGAAAARRRQVAELRDEDGELHRHPGGRWICVNGHDITDRNATRPTWSMPRNTTR